MPSKAPRWVSAGSGFLLGGLTITCSLALNAAITASFDACYPEEKDAKRRARQRWLFFGLIVAICIVVFTLTVKFTDAKQQLIVD